jgi:hypothetical protein
MHLLLMLRQDRYVLSGPTADDLAAAAFAALLMCILTLRLSTADSHADCTLQLLSRLSL